MTIAPLTTAPTARPELRLVPARPAGRSTRRPVAAAQPRASVRLTRRGRLVVFLAALLTVLSIGVALGAGSVASEKPGTPAPTEIVMVGSGETLWDIAAGLAGDGDVRAMVAKIERLNALDSAMVAAGQRLRVPVTE
ncbi:LysM peptidoglycan-binding domain-containing protein [Nocardioides sp. KIGAM211]|uniref:LysM peptidoglycan-binding domain-containing protein n=2 Tax=Nocardioides luti TaxID=2761101 RepID=A0A7X0RF73_9ACTN|nr:LysM peptidoglycan-binding domain-containing protein [Nocardioides luti]